MICRSKKPRTFQFCARSPAGRAFRSRAASRSCIDGALARGRIELLADEGFIQLPQLGRAAGLGNHFDPGTAIYRNPMRADHFGENFVPQRGIDGVQGKFKLLFPAFGFPFALDHSLSPRFREIIDGKPGGIFVKGIVGGRLQGSIQDQRGALGRGSARERPHRLDTNARRRIRRQGDAASVSARRAAPAPRRGVSFGQAHRWLHLRHPRDPGA